MGPKIAVAIPYIGVPPDTIERDIDRGIATKAT